MNIWDRIFGFFISEPQRIIKLGAALCSAMLGLMLLGSAGMLYVSAIETLKNMSNDFNPTTLATQFADYPTWFIPETIYGFLLVGGIALLGIGLVDWGNKLRRTINAF